MNWQDTESYFDWFNLETAVMKQREAIREYIYQLCDATFKLNDIIKPLLPADFEKMFTELYRTIMVGTYDIEELFSIPISGDWLLCRIERIRNTKQSRTIEASR